ncbi:MAG: electron transfer flavoprotein subunit alpha/FixB family protein [Bacteroidetes bacterium]|jgi:electron transfer flavoprotein alpha subunit|nr:electron transfer flavoprotein subunit alpha/FixB family protein [Bacteroidota bacterium]
MKILVLAEQRDGKLRKSSAEAVRAARTLADQTSGEVIALVVGPSGSGAAAETGGYGAHRALTVDAPQVAAYSTTAWTKATAEVAVAVGANAVILSATSLGKDLAPRVAVRLQAGLAADCTALRLDGGAIIATRPVYAGKALTDIRITTPVQIYTLRPNVFTSGASSGGAAPVQTQAVAFTDADTAVRVTDVQMGSGKLDVAEADIVVSGGRGLKAPENFKMIEELAAALHGAVGASRAVVDAGWRPHAEQVGQTGKTVSPTLYVAVAVSGAIQHLAGMSSSKYIVAINKDKDAPIFQVADYGIVGDAFEVVPALAAEVKKLTGGA